MPSTDDKRRAFQQMHEGGCFVMPNPWDVGSAKYLQHLGFKALATTSAGFAFSRGLADGAVTRGAVLAHIAELALATDVPLNADFENGFADEPDGVAESVRLCMATGVAGLSIEDFPQSGGALYPFELAVARVKAARAAIDSAGGGIVLTARSEGILRGVADLEETIRRLRAFAEAGADCLYAPGIRKDEEIVAIVKAVEPKPVNVLVMGPAHLSVPQLGALGVRRISLGSALANAAWGGLMRAAKEIAEAGTFKSLAANASGSEIVKSFK